MRIANFTMFSLVLIVAANTMPANAAIVNVANLKPIIGGNSDYPTGNFNTGGIFSTSNATNGVNATPNNDTGTITETFGDTSYWLGRQGDSTGYFVLDLQAPYLITDFQIFNTSNGSAIDRGTGQFTIKASQTAADTFTSVGWDLTGTIVTLASGTLTAQAYTFPLPLTGQAFLSLDSATAYRYIRFDALSIASINAPQGTGLNELRIIGTPPVPEPSTLALFGLGMAGIAIRSRCRRRSKVRQTVS